MTPTANPAVQAAAAAQAVIHECIDRRHSFLVEAGAGSGKTYSLIEAIKHVIATQGPALLKRRQLVACITYTNVAVAEIESRTDRHPAVQPSTIHAFCWSLLSPQQPALRELVPTLEGWADRLADIGDIGQRTVEYNLGHPRVEDTKLTLGHNDVINLMVQMLPKAKFRQLLAARYPIVFVDEYQDTNEAFANALRQHFLDSLSGPLLGFFGDHWQKIYDDGCGRLTHGNLKEIAKRSNFRSVPAVVNCLNRLRPALTQEVTNPAAQGQVTVFHSNAWTGSRQTGPHTAGDLQPPDAHAFLDRTKNALVAQGWLFEPEFTKVLMLTHRVLATEMGYSGIAAIFPFTDSYIKKDDPHIAFLCDVVEPVCEAFEGKRFGEMFDSLGDRTPRIRSIAEKQKWTEDLKALLELRQNGTIGQVIDLLKRTQRPRLPEKVESKELELTRLGTEIPDDSPLNRVRDLRGIPYSQLIALARYINEDTPFATKHGVKGAEFENVLVVFGRGWNRFDFNEFLEMHSAPDRIPAAKRDKYERNRNLFYVVCSRPKTNLALLFTQKLSATALSTLGTLFGAANIKDVTG